MCGIAGFWESGAGRSADELAAIAMRMAGALQHRGPDDSGVWCDPAAGLALGHQRLSIVDLSPQGHQPMSSACGRYWIVYNGEVYNHAEIRAELAGEGCQFRGGSDTEVLLEAIARWGCLGTLPRLIGMFAFAVWDKRERSLTLVRDRLGIKPLYYGWCGTSLLFASELKAIRQYPDFRAEIDRQSLALFVQHNYIPAPRSIYRGILKLAPGSAITLRADHVGGGQPNPFWSASRMAQRGCESPFAGTAEEAIDELDRLIRDATRLRMRADVPLGAFLSGGVDSSLVVAAMQSQSQQPIHTFCIGFQEPSYDESAYANAVARHLGTQHVAWRVTAHEAQQVIPRLSGVFDEPFADSSQIPTYLVSQLARSDVVVSLSGDGGDELFGGYTRYFTVARFAAWRDRLPRGTRPALTGILRRLPLNRLRLLARLIQTKHFPELYRQLNRHWDEPELLVVGAEAGAGLYDGHDTSWLGDNSLEQMMLLDAVTYLPDDILVKVDRSSMAHGLEARVPLLDHRIFEFAWSLPSHWRASGGEGKWLLRQVLQRYVPRELFQRPKVGFGVPLDAWLRGPLREWAEELLRAERLEREGFFNSRPIRDRWQQHLDRRGDWHYWLWDILMFQTWLERWK